jgi:hypothetical protein
MKFLILYKSKYWIEFFLVYSIIAFLLLSLFFLTYLIIIRLKKLKLQNIESENIPLIEKLMFSVIFDNARFETIKKENGIELKSVIFRNQLMESIINLHKNYEGIHQKKIETFYSESPLLNDSLKKLNDKRWELKCKGIEELSEMNIYEEYDSFIKLSESKNKILKITAIKGCIKLNETKGITHLINHKEVLDNWTQLNIIETIKSGNLEKIAGIELLLSSENESVVSLGLKIIQTLFLSQNEPFVQELIDSTNNLALKNEASKVMNYLQSNL